MDNFRPVPTTAGAFGWHVCDRYGEVFAYCRDKFAAEMICRSLNETGAKMRAAEMKEAA